MSFPRACQDESSIGYAPAKSLTAKNAKKAAKDAKKDLKLETPGFLRGLCDSFANFAVKSFSL